MTGLVTTIKQCMLYGGILGKVETSDQQRLGWAIGTAFKLFNDSYNDGLLFLCLLYLYDITNHFSDGL